MKRGRPAFSLIEALVVLAITGMVLAIVFSIGIRAGDAGFSLGRRALDASDSDLSRLDYRVLIESMALRPANTFAPGDPVTRGSASRLETEIVMARSNLCGRKGWAGILTLEIRDSGTGSAVVCSLAGEERTLFQTQQRAAFSYSTDGAVWSETFDNAPAQQQNFADLRSRSLWVRLAAGPQFDLVSQAASGRPDVWIRPDAEF